MAEYDPPIYDVSVFNPAYFLDEDEITKSYLRANFLEFPIGQGLETLPDLKVENASIHLGLEAGLASQSSPAVAIGQRAGRFNQGLDGVALGRDTGLTNQGANSVAIGASAGASSQGAASISIGLSAGITTQGDNAVSIGTNAGGSSQRERSIAIGESAGTTNQLRDSVAIGYRAAQTNQGSDCVAIGIDAGKINQGNQSICIGNRASESSAGSSSVSIGNLSRSAGANSVSIGNGANTNIAQRSVAIGYEADAFGTESIAIGDSATTSTYTNSIAIGNGTACSVGNQIRIGTSASAYQMEGRLNLLNSASSSLISYGNAVKMYRIENGLTIGNFGAFAVDVADITAEPASVPSVRSGINSIYINSAGRTFLGNSTNTEATFIRSAYGETYLTGYGSVAGDLQINVNNQIIRASDRRLKENIETYDEPSIDKIMKLKPSYYTWKNDKSKIPHRELGFIAQDVETIIPEAVDGKKYELEWEKDEEGEPILDASGNLQFTNTPRYRGFRDRPIIAVLVKAIQELKMEIEALKNQ